MSRSNDVVQLAMTYEVDEGNKDADDDLNNVYTSMVGHAGKWFNIDESPV